MPQFDLNSQTICGNFLIISLQPAISNHQPVISQLLSILLYFSTKMPSEHRFISFLSNSCSFFHFFCLYLPRNVIYTYLSLLKQKDRERSLSKQIYIYRLPISLTPDISHCTQTKKTIKSCFHICDNP